MKKGPLAEAQIVAYLRENGYPHAERRVMGGVNDRGDVAGVPGVVIEIKNQAEMKLAAWVDEALREAVPICGSPQMGVVWHKRRGQSSPGEWYVTMRGSTFVEMLKETRL